MLPSDSPFRRGPPREPRDDAPGALARVLLVEDDPGDVLIAREALRAGRLTPRLDVVPDGVEAMAYLRKRGRLRRRRAART